MKLKNKNKFLNIVDGGVAEDDAMYIHCFSRRKDVVGTLKVATDEATHTVIMARMWIRAKEINCTMQVSNPATTITSGEWSNPPSEFLKMPGWGK